MGLIKKILMLFGRQYVMLRYSNSQVFHVKHAYCIAGHWYVKSADGGGNFILTNSIRVTDLEHPHFDPATMVSSNELWIPVTNRVDAGVRMYD